MREGREIIETLVTPIERQFEILEQKHMLTLLKIERLEAERERMMVRLERLERQLDEKQPRVFQPVRR